MRLKWCYGFVLLVGSAIGGPAIAFAAPEFGDPLPGLPSDLKMRFAEGKAEFLEEKTPESGLGPLFNGRSCGGRCHSTPAVGGASSAAVTRFGTTDGNGDFDPLEALGGSLLQSRVIDGCAGESVPAEATIVTKRLTTPVFGAGLIDAVPDDVFMWISVLQHFFWPDTAGYPNMVKSPESGDYRVGKFGWKAQVPSVAEFSAGAYFNEMGITNPMFPDEDHECDEVPDPEDDGTVTDKLTDYMTYLGAPPPLGHTPKARAGEIVFHKIGCAQCHLPVLLTGPNEVAALDRVRFAPYSDFLLHDMGSLGDGIEQGQASGSEMRTAPLWGLRGRKKLLHDGRTEDVKEAILAHDGQGSAARDAFAALNAQKKAQLVAFLKTL